MVPPMAMPSRLLRLFGGARHAALSLLSGILMALGQAPWSMWPVALVALSGLCLLILRAPDQRRSMGTAWLGGTGYFALSLFWIVEPFFVDVARHGWMAPFALVILSGGLGLLWGAAGAIAGAFPASGKGAAFVLTLSLIEMSRNVLFTGFPWGLVSYIWSGHAIMQIAAWTGPFGLAALTIGVAMLAAQSVHSKSMVPGLVAFVMFAGMWGSGVARLSEAQVVQTGQTVRLLQPNAAQHLKWQRDMIPVFFSAQLEMTRTARAGGVDLVVWPESAVGYRLDRTPEALEYIARAGDGVPVVFGGNALVDGAYHNTMAAMGADGEIYDWYYKHHLVPFGEYIPLGDLLSQLGIRGLAARDGGGFGPGPGPRLIDVPGLGRVLPLICYELIFPQYARSEPRPEMILQITNDAWFGKISGPYQHLVQAQFRAVEQGLPLLRSANTGVSAAIDPYGRVIAELGLGQEGFLDVPVVAPLVATPYARLGDWPVAVALMIAFAGLAALGRRHERDT